MMSNYNEHYIFQAKELLKYLTSTSHEAYIVGECLRDLVTDNEIKEVEIYSSLSKESLINLFNKEDIIEEHDSSVRVIYQGMTFLISLAATYTFDYKQNRKVNIKIPRRHYSTSLMDFLETKIYSVNTLAMGSNNIIHDCFTGRQDIMHKKIKMICDNPKLIFTDQAIKMLEAIRLVSQLGYKLDEQIYKAIKKKQKGIVNAKLSDILNEMEAIINGKYAKRGIKLLIKTKLYKRMPLFKYEIKRLYNNYRREDFDIFLVTSLIKNPDYLVRIAPNRLKEISHYETLIQLANSFPKSNYDVTTLFNNQLDNLLKANIINFNLGRAKNKQRQIARLYNHLVIKNINELAITKKDIIFIDNQLDDLTVSDILREACNSVLHNKVKNNYNALKDYCTNLIEETKNKENLEEVIIQSNEKVVENTLNDDNTLVENEDVILSDINEQVELDNNVNITDTNNNLNSSTSELEELIRRQEEFDRRLYDLEIQTLKKELNEDIERKIMQSGLLEGLYGAHRQSTYNTLKKVYYDVLVKTDKYQKLDNEGDNNGND